MSQYPTDFSAPTLSVDNVADFREFKDSDVDNDGILSGSELTGVTNTIGDFAALSETIPTTGSFAATPATMLGKLGKQIAYFQDKLDPRRTIAAKKSVSVSGIASNGTITTVPTAHDLAIGTPVMIDITSGNMLNTTVWYVRSTGWDGAGNTLTLAAAVDGSGAAITAADAEADAAKAFVLTVVVPMIDATDTIKDMAHGLVNGDNIMFTGTGGGVTTTDVYYVINKTTDTFQICATATGTSAVEFTHVSPDVTNSYAKVPTTAELSYAAQLCSIKYNDLMAECMSVCFELKRLAAVMGGIDSTGPLGTSPYPSGN